MNRLTIADLRRLFLRRTDEPGRVVPWGIGFLLAFAALSVALAAVTLPVTRFLDSAFSGPIPVLLTRIHIQVAMMCVVVIIAMAVLFRTRYNMSMERATGLVPFWRGKISLLAVAAGMMTATASAALYLTVRGGTSRLTPLGANGTEAVYLIPTSLSITLVLPLLEELFFRGLLYPWLRQYCNAPTSLLTSSSLFALAHGWTMNAIVSFPLGLLCGYAYEKTRALSLPYLLHAAHNGSAAIYAVLIRTYAT